MSHIFLYPTSHIMWGDSNICTVQVHACATIETPVIPGPHLNWGGEGVNHVKRDWLEILNVNCDLYLFFCVKRDWGYLRET